MPTKKKSTTKSKITKSPSRKSQKVKVVKSTKNIFRRHPLRTLGLIILVGAILLTFSRTYKNESLYDSNAVPVPATINRIIEVDPATAKNDAQTVIIKKINVAADKFEKAKTTEAKENATVDLLIQGTALEIAQDPKNNIVNSSQVSAAEELAVKELTTGKDKNGQQTLSGKVLVQSPGNEPALNESSETGKSLRDSTVVDVPVCYWKWLKSEQNVGNKTYAEEYEKCLNRYYPNGGKAKVAARLKQVYPQGGSGISSWKDPLQQCQSQYNATTVVLGANDSCREPDGVFLGKTRFTPCSKFIHFGNFKWCRPDGEGVQTKITCCGNSAGINAAAKKGCENQSVTVNTTLKNNVTITPESFKTASIDGAQLKLGTSEVKINGLICKSNKDNKCLNAKALGIEDIKGVNIDLVAPKCSFAGQSGYCCN